MGICIEKIRHDTCGHNALQVFKDEETDVISGYCFACGTFVANPYSDPNYKPAAPKRKTDEEIDEEASEVYSLPDAVDLPSRKLKSKYLNHYGYKIGLSRADGITPAVMYRPYYNDKEELVAYKAKVMEAEGKKPTWWISKGDEVMPFGWHQAVAAGGKNLYITEGEEDCVALYQAMKEANLGTQYEKFSPSVVSIPHGAGSAAKYLAKISDHINRHFKGIVLVFDQDEAGTKGAEAVCKQVFNHAQVAILPSKDANQCLIDGREKALVKAVSFNAAVPKNSRLVTARTLHEQAKVPAVWGKPWPWDGITQLTRGIRTGETVYIGAAQKQGKSEVANTLIAHCITELGWKVLAAKPEEANVKTYKMVAGKIAGKIFHDPKVEFDNASFDAAGEVIGDNLYLVNVYQHLGYDSLKKDIQSAAAEGCKAIFIDPITCLVNGMDSSAANTELQKIAQDLSAMALDLDVVIFIFCHLKNPESGVPHERGGKVLSGQFAGSRAMARSCNLMVGLEGNRDPDLSVEERNMRKLVVLENRETGEVGNVDLYYDAVTGLFNEIV